MGYNIPNFLYYHTFISELHPTISYPLLVPNYQGHLIFPNNTALQGLQTSCSHFLKLIPPTSTGLFLSPHSRALSGIIFSKEANLTILHEFAN